MITSLLIVFLIYAFVCGLLLMWNLEKPIPEREKRRIGIVVEKK
jgi:hypothetical protein|tara:strand:+ start:353 stop:484 length:132 start_codon:yes stop_codon:yes gene_type:complete